MSPFTAEGRQRYAIARSAERRREQLAPMRAEVARAIAEVGWPRAKPVVVEALAPRWHVGGARGPWIEHVGARSGQRILTGLTALPVQGRLPLTHPISTLKPKEATL